MVRNHLLGGGFGRRLETDYVVRAVEIATGRWPGESRVTRERISSTTCIGLTGSTGSRPDSMRTESRSPGTITTPAHRSSRDGPPLFNKGLDPDTTEGAIDLWYALPSTHVEYVRVEPPGIPPPSGAASSRRNIFVTEGFMDELAVAAKQDPVAYRLALLDKTPRAKAVLALAAEKAGRKPLPANGAVKSAAASRSNLRSRATWHTSPRSRWRRTDRCGSSASSMRSIAAPWSIPTPCGHRSSGIIFGITAALYGKITLKDGRVEQTNFDSYQILRMNEAPAIEVHIVQSSKPPGGMGGPGPPAFRPP